MLLEKKQLLNCAAWNVRTTNYSVNSIRPERATTIICRALEEADIVICALRVRLSPFSRVESRFNSHNQNAFQGDLGDDKRKAVLIMGLETPFRDAAFISTFSGVELRFPNDFQGDFCR